MRRHHLCRGTGEYVSVATRHAMLNTKPTMENYGRALLGEPLITDYV